jgi:hypothetical protein
LVQEELASFLRLVVTGRNLLLRHNNYVLHAKKPKAKHHIDCGKKWRIVFGPRLFDRSPKPARRGFDFRLPSHADLGIVPQDQGTDRAVPSFQRRVYVQKRKLTFESIDFGKRSIPFLI